MSFDDLLGDQPDVPDWPGLVRRRITALRTRRRVAVTLAATSMVVLGTVGAVYATSGDTTPTSVVALRPSDTSTPEATQPPAPTQTPTPLGTASPLSTPTTTPTSSPTPLTGVPGIAGWEDQDIVISGVTYSPHDPSEGDVVTVRFHVRWSAARPYAGARCVDCNPHGDPVPYPCTRGAGSAPPKEPGEADFSAFVEMLGPGAHRVVVSAATECGWYIGRDEVVLAIPTAASPTPAPTPTADDTPTPTVTPT